MPHHVCDRLIINLIFSEYACVGLPEFMRRFISYTDFLTNLLKMATELAGSYPISSVPIFETPRFLFEQISPTGFFGDMYQFFDKRSGSFRNTDTTQTVVCLCTFMYTIYLPAVYIVSRFGALYGYLHAFKIDVFNHDRTKLTSALANNRLK